MKIYILLICSLFLIQFASGQGISCVTDGSSTIPFAETSASSSTDPCLKNWQVNKFNWYAPLSGIFYSNIVGQTNANQIVTPFTDLNSPHSAGGANYLTPIWNDYLPEKGWELIKQDFGYFNNDNFYGDLSPHPNHPIVTAIPKDNTTEYIQSKIPYLILYNKYRGVLRVMGYVQSDVVNFVKVNVSFSRQVRDAITKNVIGSGIFRPYESGSGGETALDQPTYGVKNVSAYAVSPINVAAGTNGDGQMFYADFNLGYDPCVCKIKSGITIEFTPNSQQTFQAFGLSVDAATAASTSNYFSSVLEDPNNHITNGVATFSDYNALQTSLNTLATSYTSNVQDNTAQTVADLNLASGLLGASGTGVSAVPTPVTGIIGAILQGAGAIVSFISSEISINNPPAVIPQVSAFSGTVNLNGIRSSFGVATPGSPQTQVSSTNMSEYGNEFDPNNNNAPNNWYFNPVYPMYNEPLGVFAMLKTPTVSLIYEQDYANVNGSRVHFELPAANNIVFAVNPVLNIKSSEFRGLLEITVPRYEFPTTITPSAVEYLTLIKDDGTNAVFQTPLLPFEKLALLKPVVINDNYILPHIVDVKLKVLGTIIYNDTYTDTDGTKKYNSALFIRTFSLNRNESTTKDNYHSNLVNNPKNILSTSAIHYNTNGLICTNNYSDIPLDMVITDPNILTAASGCPGPSIMNVYAWNTIKVETNVNYSGQLNLYADEVSLENEASISGEAVLSNESPFSGGGILPNLSLPVTVDDAFLTSTCSTKTNSLIQYQADVTNIAARLDAEASNTSNTKPSPVARQFGTPNLTAIPNPTNGQVTFYYKVPTDGEVSISINNILGAKIADVLKNEFKPTGQYQKQLDLSQLAVGVYMVTIETNGYKQTERLVISK